MIVAFLFDGIIMNHFSAILLEAGYTLVPRIVIIVLVMMTFLVDSSSLFWFAVIVGLMVDSYYSGVLGIYMAIFAAMVRIIWVIRGNMTLNPFTLGLALIFLLTLTETSVYLVYLVQGMTRLTWQDFLVQRLVSSVVLNVVLYYILYIPLRNFARWINAGAKQTAYTSLRRRRR